MEHLKEFNELISNGAKYLEFQLHFKTRTVDQYKRYWKRVRNFMSLNKIKSYSQDVEKEFLCHAFNDRSKKDLSEPEKHIYNSIRMLTEFKEKGYMSILPRTRKTPIVFSGSIGDICTSFLEYKKREERSSPETIEIHRNYLSGFLNHCNEQSISDIKDISLAVIFQFIRQAENKRHRRDGGVITALRGFLKYAFEQKLVAIDYSLNMPRYKSVNQPQMPSTYSEEEITKLLSSVERSSTVGKRDYAMILIAAKLGFRAADIASLKFENLHWDKCAIEIRQYKTGKELVAPLLPDVGNAIIDYLKFARPKSEAPYVFLRERPPYDHLTNGKVVTLVVQTAFKRSGIDTKGRRHGAHSLRHSLVSRMLEKSTMLPVISEVLGHKNTGSTKYYLRIDIKSMAQCVLDVPPVPNSFYEQRGGAFYD